jgi:hypothetical protein
VVFNGNVATNAPLTLSGDVLLSGNLTLTNNTLTLGAGKTISVQFTPTSPRGSSAMTAPVLSAGPEDDVVLRSGTGTVLAVTPAPANETAGKRLTLGTADLTITDGTLQVVEDATFVINGVALTTNITNTQFGYLAMDAGGTINLTGTGSVVIGETEIDEASTLIARGGTVTLGNNKIAGSAVGAVLTLPERNGGIPEFTLDPDKILILEQVDLNLAVNGRLILTAAATDSGTQVVLRKQAKITLNNGEGGIRTTRSNITGGGNVGVLSKGVGYIAPNATTNQTVWSVAQEGTSEASITASTAGGTVTLSKSATSFTP